MTFSLELSRKRWRLLWEVGSVSFVAVVSSKESVKLSSSMRRRARNAASAAQDSIRSIA